MKLIFRVPTVSLFIGAMLATSASAQTLKKIRIGYPSLSFRQSNVWVATDVGLFKKYGLEVEPIFLRGGQVATQALAGGDPPIGNICTGGQAHLAGVHFVRGVGFPTRAVAGDHPPIVNIGTVVQADLTGFDLVLVAAVETSYDQIVFARPGITNLEQLKGKRFGISGFGAATNYAALILMKHLNFQPKDLTLLPTGPDAERLAAMSAGKIDATFFTSSSAAPARKAGFVELLQIGDLGVEVQGNGLATSRTYAQTNHDVVKNALKGFVEAIYYIYANKKEAQRVFAKYMRTNDPEVLEDSYNGYIHSIPKKPYPTLKGIQFMLDMLAEKMPQAKAAKPEQIGRASC